MADQLEQERQAGSTRTRTPRTCPQVLHWGPAASTQVKEESNTGNQGPIQKGLLFKTMG